MFALQFAVAAGLEPIVTSSSDDKRARALVGKNARLQGVSVGSAEMYRRMVAFITAQGIAPVIDSVYPFAQAPDAFRALAQGAHFGKILIDFSA